jgi:hypothetical protein
MNMSERKICVRFRISLTVYAPSEPATRHVNAIP